MAAKNGKVVFITGAAGGLGTALARDFAQAGWSLFLTDKDESRLAGLIQKLVASGAQAAGTPIDLCSASAAQAIADDAFQAYGKIDSLVNNAGVSLAKSFWDLTESDWDLVLDVNVKALFFTLQATARHMRDRGGSIINIASVAGRLPRPKLLHYAASKAAVISITRSAALELAPHKIRVNAVAPGMMDTEMLHSLQSDLEKVEGGSGGQPGIANIPLRRIAQPEEIAPTVLYLAEDASAYITGQTVNVCGGIAMS